MDPSVSARLTAIIGDLGTPPADRPLCRVPTVATVTRCEVDAQQVLAALRAAGWDANLIQRKIVYIRTDNAPDRQPREREVLCQFASPKRPHFTFNPDCVCDEHQSLRRFSA